MAADDAADPARSPAASPAATAAVTALLYFLYSSSVFHLDAESWLDTPDDEDEPPEEPPDADHFRWSGTAASSGTTSTAEAATRTGTDAAGEVDATWPPRNSKVGEGAVQCSRLEPDPPPQHMIPVTRPEMNRTKNQ